MAGGIGLFGGTFNPIHFGHLIIAQSVVEQLDLDRMIFIPSSIPPHKQHQALLDARHRFEMVRLAIEGDDTFEVSDVEIQRSGPSYTVDTVQAFRSEFGDEIELCWLIGGDSLAELHTWYQIDRLASLCRLVTAVRPGFEQPDLTELEGMLGREKVQELRRDILSTPRIDISATHLRERVGKSVSIRYHTPRSVETYIQDNRLYRE